MLVFTSVDKEIFLPTLLDKNLRHYFVIHVSLACGYKAMKFYKGDLKGH